MRVLMTADTVGGVWVYALDLARGLGHLGVEITLATMGAPLSPAQRKAVEAIPNVSVEESGFRLEWMADPWDDVDRAGDWLMELAARIDPDLVHLNGYCHAALPWEIPAIVVAHSDVVSWWQAVHGTSPPAEWKRYRQEVTRGLHAADVILAPSLSTLRDVQRNFGPFATAHVIPNGRDLGYPRPAPSAEKSQTILSVGRLWDEAKNIRILDSAAADLPWRVLVAGDTTGPDGKDTALASVVPLGLRSPEELARNFAEASIYALPARYEPFGLSVLEAAAFGCALLLGDIPSLRENWDGAAVFVDPADPASVRAGLRHLIDHPAERERLAASARSRAQAFTVRRMALAYYQEYLRLTRPWARELLPANTIAEPLRTRGRA